VTRDVKNMLFAREIFHEIFQYFNSFLKDFKLLNTAVIHAHYMKIMLFLLGSRHGCVQHTHTDRQTMLQLQQ